MNFQLNDNSNNFNKYSYVQSELVLEFNQEIQPVLSIIIPTFRRPNLLREALESAVKQVTKIAYEIVIVDNDSDGEYKDIIIKLLSDFEHISVRYFVNEENIGMFGNWNRCIELAKAEYLTILNDDDALGRLWLERILILGFSERLVFTRYKKFQSSGELQPLLNTNRKVKPLISTDLHLSRFICSHQTNGTLGVLLKRSNAIQLGGFDETLFPVADYWFFLKYSFFFGAIRVEEELAYFRWSENESMKLQTMQQTLSGDYQLKLSVINSLFYKRRFRAKILRVLSRAIIVKKAQNYSRLNVDFRHYQEVDKTIGVASKFYIWVINKVPYRIFLLAFIAIGRGI